jgi:hypothetical protein
MGLLAKISTAPSAPSCTVVMLARVRQGLSMFSVDVGGMVAPAG